MLNFVHEDQSTGGATSSPSVMASDGEMMWVFGQWSDSQRKVAFRVLRLLLKKTVSTDSAYNEDVVSVHLPPMHAYLIRHLAQTNSTTVSAVVRDAIGEYLESHKG